MKDGDPYVVLEWNSSSAIQPIGEPTDYAYEARGNLIDIAQDQTRTIAGRFGCYYMDIDRARNDGMPAFEVFDAYASTSIFYDAIFDAETEDYSPKVTKLCGGIPLYGNVLILDRLEILPKYRGRGLGLVTIRHMILRFGAGAGLVALKPFPLQLEPASRRGEINEWRSKLNLSEFTTDAKAATKRLISYYATLGFERLPGTKLMLRSNELPLPDVETE